MKANTGVTIDVEVLKLAKNRQINISAFCEQALAREVLQSSVSEQDKAMLCAILEEEAQKNEEKCKEVSDFKTENIRLRGEIALASKGKNVREVMDRVKKRFPLRITARQQWDYLSAVLVAVKEAPLEPEEKAATL